MWGNPRLPDGVRDPAHDPVQEVPEEIIMMFSMHSNIHMLRRYMNFGAELLDRGAKTAQVALLMEQQIEGHGAPS